MALLAIVHSFLLSLHHLLKPDLPPLFAKMTMVDKLLFLIVHLVDRFYAWHRLPVLLGMAYLEVRRTLHQHYNLISVGRMPFNIRFNPQEVPFRTANGQFNDPFNSDAGEQGSFFGRNMVPFPAFRDPSSPTNETLHLSYLYEPHPTLVATKLLARKNLVDTGTQFNMLAASWIQFMIHDWIDHEENMDQEVKVTASSSIASKCPLKSYKFYPSKELSTNSYEIPIGYKNRRTPWWDGSVIYGNDAVTLERVRTFKDGKLHLGNDGLLKHDSQGLPISGDIRNGWVGISLLQALFIKEHNAVCDMLKLSYPELTDEELYRHARSVTAAVIAKIHTIDWTVELLKTDTLHASMQANWYGLLGKRFKEHFGHTGIELLSGYVGMPRAVNHGVPYSLTEDFVSVYRMHSLMPDVILVRNIEQSVNGTTTPPIEKEIPVVDLIHAQGETVLASVGNETMLVSMGHQACGALTLWNYPSWMRELIPEDIDGKERTNLIDLASLDVYRDRERHVPRYNEFRRGMLMIAIKEWQDLTDDKEAIAALKEVYGNDVEKLDLLVGLMAEKKIKGYAISETAFFIFLLMASRRLEADRFFTSDFNETVYTKEGLKWVNTTESLKDVLARHHSHVVEKWLNPNISAFSLWSAASPPNNHIPIYLRVPSS